MESHRFTTVQSEIHSMKQKHWQMFLLFQYALPVDRNFCPGESYLQCALYSFFVLAALHIHFQTLPYCIDDYIKLSHLY